MNAICHPDAMTEAEIQAFYREAKDKNKAVEILADYNATDADTIIDVLRRAGLISGLPGNHTAQSGAAKVRRADQLIALVDRGLTAAEAAAEMGLSIKSIYALASKHGIKFAKAQRKSASSAQRSPHNAKCKTEAPQRSALGSDAAETLDMVQMLQWLLADGVNRLLGAGALPIQCEAKDETAVVIATSGGWRYRVEISRQKSRGAQ